MVSLTRSFASFSRGSVNDFAMFQLWSPDSMSYQWHSACLQQYLWLDEKRHPVGPGPMDAQKGAPAVKRPSKIVGGMFYHLIAVAVWLTPVRAQSSASAARQPRAGERSDIAVLDTAIAGPGSESATIAPGSQYRKSGIWTVFAGRHYRTLWGTPIRVPVLDLEHFAGGLRALEAHTGSQTKSLRLAGADGREYQFRSVDKDPTVTLGPDLRGTAYSRALRDGVSASFPAAPLVANGLLEVAGVLAQPQSLTLMPDDPRLGEFRSDFKGVLGLIEERTDARDEAEGIAGGLRQVISPTGLFRRVDASPADRVDARAFLRARLMDIYMGDRDRHRDQFRWAAFGSGHPTVWQPISRDHDEAFVNLDGLALRITALYYPPLVTFGPTYPQDIRLNWHAREVDRRFLVSLDRATWDSVATDLQGRLTDVAIDSAVRRMPPEMYPVGGERLTRVLRARRDGLEREALRYYGFLAREVEIRATDAPEVAEVTRADPHHLQLTIRVSDDTQPYFQRRFDDRETHEVRLMMWGGDDRVVVRGADASGIKLRVVGGAGDDRFVDSTRTGGTRFYDDRGQNTAQGPHRVSINTKHQDEWVGSDTDRYPPREWGTAWQPLPWFEANNDVGLFIGAGAVHTRYGFRRAPFASQIRVRAGYATGAASGRGDLDAEVHPENASHFWRLGLRASGVDVLRYYGLGNDSPNTGASDFYRVDQQRYSAEPALVVPVGRRVQVSAGPFVRWTSTSSNAGRFIAPLRDTLLGGRDLGQVGARLGVAFDTRDRPVNPRRGIRISVAGEVSPAVWDVSNTYGDAQAEASAFVSAPLPTRPTLALRAGGRRVWGAFPFFESAFLGGASTLGGYRSHRFAGDASLYGGAELRLTMGKSHLALPAQWGLYGGGDVGRVYLGGESPGGWHGSGGGGLWLAFLDRRNTVSVGFASSTEGTRVEAGAAFGW